MTNTVNDQPLGYDLFYSLATKDGFSHETQILCSILPVNIETLKAKPHWILVTKDIIPNSLGKSYNKQKEMASIYPMYRIPKAMEMTQLLSMHHIIKKEHLYPDGTFTRCQDIFEQIWLKEIEGPFNPDDADTTHAVCVGRLEKRECLEIQAWAKKPDGEIGLALCRDL